MARSRPSISVAATAAGYGPYAYNITPDNTSIVRNAWLGSNTVSIAFMGDSTMRGVDEGALPYNTQYSLYSMPARLAAKMSALGINSTADNWYGVSGINLADYTTRDSRIAVTGATVDSAVIQGGAALALTAASSVSFTTVGNCNKADIYQYDFFGGATISYQVDGGAATNIVQVGNNTIKKTTISLGTSGVHTVKINWVSGANSLFGIDCYDDTKKQLTIRQWGISGGTAGSMVDDSGTPHAGRLTQMANFPPKLVISECGLVNSWRTSASVASAKADMQTLITAVKAAGSNFMFLTPPYDNGSAGLTASQDDYVKAMYDLAYTNNVGVIDIRRAHVTYKNAVTYGWMRSTDNVHLAGPGYDNEADIISQILFRVLL